MKLLYWTSLFWPELGGIEVLALETLPALRERGYEICVIVGRSDKRLPDLSDFEGIPVHRFDFHGAFQNRDLTQLKDVTARVAAIRGAFCSDVVHLNFVGYGPFFHLRTRSVHPAPTLMAVHSDFSSWKSGPDTLYGGCLRSAQWVCGVSRATLADVLEAAPEVAPRASVVFNGLRLPALSPAPLPFEPPHVVCIGRLAADKGFDIALSAFAALLRTHPVARMTIAGDGIARHALEAHCGALGLAGSVRFTGRMEREQIALLLNSATLVVVPSRYAEPFALVALEAAQMARPVVATDWGGLRETVEDGRSGILVESENVEAFAEAMRFLLDHPERARQMGEHGRQRAQELFGLARCVNQYDELYRQLAGLPADE